MGLLSDQERERARKRAVDLIEKAGIYLKEEEKRNLEIASMGLGTSAQYIFALCLLINSGNNLRSF